jgi:hypothetical protein
MSFTRMPWLFATSLPLFLALVASFAVAPAAHALSSLNELTGWQAEDAVSNELDWNPTTKPPVIKAKGAKATDNQMVSRYEMAVALSKLLGNLNDQLTSLEAQKADKADIEALQRLQAQARTDLQTLTASLNEGLAVNATKNAEQDGRIKLLERVQIHGDMTVGALADISNGGTGGNTQLQDSISSVARLRLNIDVPVVEPENEDSKWGQGIISTRLIAAVGRYGPAGNAGGNTGTNYAFNAYSRVSSDVSAFNEGFGTGAAGKLQGQNGLTSNTRANLFMESAFYKQKLRSGVPLLTDLPGFDIMPDSPDWKTTGDIYAGIVRWWDLFDVSPYRGNEMAQFQNNAFINIPGIAVNVAQPMVGYALHQGLGKAASADFTTAIGSVDVGDALNGLNLTYEAKLNYLPTFLPEAMQKPGSAYVGAYHIWLAGNRNFNKNIQTASSYTRRDGTAFDPNFGNSNVTSVYAGWNQEWFRGIGTNVSFLYNPNSPTAILFTTQQPGPANVAAGAKTSLSSVVSIPMTAFGKGTFRPNDSIGLGYAYVQVMDGGSDFSSISGRGLEHVAEAYYRFQINPSFNIMPSVQVIGNSLGLTQNKFNTVLGCRMNYMF